MSKKSRSKGYRGERYFVQAFKESGLNAVRVPLSGATEFVKGDLVVEGMVAEVKIRHNGFRKLYKWLENRDLLCLKADGKEGLIVMPLERFVKLTGGTASHEKVDKRQ